MSPMSSWNAGECVSPTSDGDLLTKLKFHCKRDTNDVSRGTAVRAREGTYCDRYVAQKHFDREIENLSRGTVMGWKRRKPLSSVVVPVPVPDPESCVSGGALCVVLFVLCAICTLCLLCFLISQRKCCRRLLDCGIAPRALVSLAVVRSIHATHLSEGAGHQSPQPLNIHHFHKIMRT